MPRRLKSRTTRRTTTKRTRRCRTGKKRTCYATHQEIYTQLRKAGVKPIKLLNVINGG